MPKFLAELDLYSYNVKIDNRKQKKTLIEWFDPRFDLKRP